MCVVSSTQTLSSIEVCNKKVKGVSVAYHYVRLVGNRKQMPHEVKITDLEYADDMASVSSSWDNLTAMIAILN